MSIKLKRSFDFVASIFGLTILLPLLLFLGVIVFISSPGGIFFRGKRVGQNGRIFKIYKFRTMIMDAEGNGKWNVGSNDVRVTKIGKYLRKTKLDELPQLINVLKGDMSLVGPRPELKYYVDMYVGDEKSILDLKPGITDWASIVNIEQFKLFTLADNPDDFYLKYIRPLKLELQLYYRNDNSFLSDLQILFLTLFKVISKSQKVPRKIRGIVNNYNEKLEREF